MTSPTKPSRDYTVLVGVDYSDLGALALKEAVTLARAHERSHVHVIHALPLAPAPDPSAPPYAGAIDDDAATEASHQLRAYLEKVLAPSLVNSADGRAAFEHVTIHIRRRNPADVIVQLAAEIQADLVVVGTHGRHGVSRFLMGSVAEAVVRTAPCPVLVVRPVEPDPADVPKLAPACALCVEARRASEGRELWCPQHREHHERRHTYSFSVARSGHQSGLLIPMSRSRS